MATNLFGKFVHKLCVSSRILSGRRNGIRGVTTTQLRNEKQEDGVAETKEEVKPEKEVRVPDTLKGNALRKEEEIDLGLDYSRFVQKCDLVFREDPGERVVRCLKYDWARIKQQSKALFGIEYENELEKYTYGVTSADVVIIGGGAMGSSCAFWLREIFGKGISVAVIEKDLTYRSASTSLSVGGLRQQFSLKENIEMSLFGAEFLRTIHKTLKVDGLPTPNVCFQPHGYLLLASEEGADTLTDNSELQNALGARNILLTPRRLKERFPWLNTEGIALGCLGLEKEGWFDPWALMLALKTKAINLGADYVNGEVVGFQFYSPDGHPYVYDQNYRKVRGVIVRRPDGLCNVVKFAKCIIAAGAESGSIARLLGLGLGPGILNVPLPVERRKRYVYCFHSPNGPGLDTPLTVDPSGVYFRREGTCGNYIAGLSPSPDEEPMTEDLDVDYEYFDEKVWPRLAARVPNFENLKMRSAWAGFYEYNPVDMNGIVGCHPLFENILFACGFSGHGIQHAPAVGRALAEFVVNDEYRNIDLTRMNFSRFITDELLFEKNIV